MPKFEVGQAVYVRVGYETTDMKTHHVREADVVSCGEKFAFLTGFLFPSIWKVRVENIFVDYEEARSGAPLLEIKS